VGYGQSLGWGWAGLGLRMVLGSSMFELRIRMTFRYVLFRVWVGLVVGVGLGWG
jgi:hypothetical protein